MTTRCTPREAAELVRPRDTVGFGLGPGNPDAFLTALGERDDWERLVLGGALLLGYYTVLTKPGVSYRSGFFGPAERILLAEGHDIELVPGGFRQFAPILARFAPRIMTAQAAPPDADGRVNLSLHYGATRDELLRAGNDPDRVLLVEVNPKLPRTHSLAPEFDNTLPLELIDVLVEADGDPYVLADPAPSAEDAAIAAQALEFVTDGSTLQTGIGAIPSMIATKLADGAGGGYGVHSEMFTTGLMRLHQAGKVTNDAKGIFDGVSVTTFALGSTELYEWLDGNAEVAFLPVDVVNDPTVIGRNRKLVSINGALCVDLYGQIVADNVDGKQISGVGGHEDFVSGADLRADAHSLVCLHVHGDRRRRGAIAHPPRAAGRRDRVDAPTPHRRGRHRVRRGRADRAHGARAGERARRHRPSGLPGRVARGRGDPGPAVNGVKSTVVIGEPGLAVDLEVDDGDLPASRVGR